MVIDSINTVAVLGAGTMGNGIAHVFARAGYQVILRDVEQRFLDRALETIAKNPPDFDTQYFFNKLPKGGSYRGFSLRYRYAARSQQFAPAGVAPLFKYNRFQAEYDI